MREDLKRRKQQMKKSDGPVVEIAGVTPELKKLASEALPEVKKPTKSYKEQAQDYDRKGWGVVEPES